MKRMQLTNFTSAGFKYMLQQQCMKKLFGPTDAKNKRQIDDITLRNNSLMGKHSYGFTYKGTPYITSASMHSWDEKNDLHPSLLNEVAIIVEDKEEYEIIKIITSTFISACLNHCSKETDLHYVFPDCFNKFLPVVPTPTKEVTYSLTEKQRASFHHDNADTIRIIKEHMLITLLLE